ncbi:hypothetical protein OH77DRAFT_1163720 [Trametes cingulata]|nr:hypothetical protein OH77DRAFT_1163720 [Trametes cingulata]
MKDMLHEHPGLPYSRNSSASVRVTLRVLPQILLQENSCVSCLPNTRTNSSDGEGIAGPVDCHNRSIAALCTHPLTQRGVGYIHCSAGRLSPSNSARALLVCTHLRVSYCTTLPTPRSPGFQLPRSIEIQLNAAVDWSSRECRRTLSPEPTLPHLSIDPRSKAESGRNVRSLPHHTDIAAIYHRRRPQAQRGSSEIDHSASASTPDCLDLSMVDVLLLCPSAMQLGRLLHAIQAQSFIFRIIPTYIPSMPGCAHSSLGLDLARGVRQSPQSMSS